MSQKDCLKNLMLRYLHRKEWNYTVKEDSNAAFIVTDRFALESKMKECIVNIIVTDKYIMSRATCPIKVTDDVRDKVVEFITRANSGLTLGAFEYNYNNDEVIFRASLSTIEGEPSMQDINRIVCFPIQIFNWFGNGLIKTLMGFGDPKADVEEAKKL